jgi:low iron-inducible protein
MVAWALHELDAAVDKAAKGSFTKKSGAPHNWDEVWAYYHGEKPECSPFATANARGEEFGVGTLINRRLLLSMKDGLKALVDSKSASAARKIRDDVMRDVTITYMQSVIRSASEIDAALAQGKADEARLRQAEGWAYYRVIEPLIAKANTTTAQTLAGVFDLAAKPAAGSAAKVTAALSSAYDALGISPSDIGQRAGAVDGAQAGDASGAQDGEPEDGEPDDGK